MRLLGLPDLSIAEMINIFYEGLREECIDKISLCEFSSSKLVITLNEKPFFFVRRSILLVYLFIALKVCIKFKLYAIFFTSQPTYIFRAKTTLFERVFRNKLYYSLRESNLSVKIYNDSIIQVKLTK